MYVPALAWFDPVQDVGADPLDFLGECFESAGRYASYALGSPVPRSEPAGLSYDEWLSKAEDEARFGWESFDVVDWLGELGASNPQWEQSATRLAWPC